MDDSQLRVGEELDPKELTAEHPRMRERNREARDRAEAEGQPYCRGALQPALGY